MTTSMNARAPAYLCVALLLLCALATFPVAEIGMSDDWSYIESARVLAQTGHIVYNGWAGMMLGWQLFLGASFARLFGPSFTAIRASTMPVALATAYLTHRTLVRAGVYPRNATIGTLTLVLSPLFLPLALSFMSDIGGLFSIVLCLYACLRALEAQSDRATLLWLGVAALSNAAGGTVRQIAWLGVLVLFPCAVWLLRRRSGVLVLGSLLYLASIAFILVCLRWFDRQRYSVSVPLIPANVSLAILERDALQFASMILSSALFLLPVLAAFVAARALREKRTQSCLVWSALLCGAAGLCLALRHPHAIAAFLAPFRGDYVNPYGLVATFAVHGMKPAVLTPSLRIAITLAVYLALLCFFAVCIASRAQKTLANTLPPISRYHLTILLLPFVIASFLLILSRGLSGELSDRYTLPLLPIGLIFLLRCFQERVQPTLPLATYGLVLLFALYAIAGTHDAFSMSRSQHSAIAELRAAGVPDTRIDGGFVHNAATQVERYGSINDAHIRRIASAYIADSPRFPSGCQPSWAHLTPAIEPGYTLSFDPKACGGPSRFPPVPYFNWLGMRAVTIYVVDTVHPAVHAQQPPGKPNDGR